MVTVAPNDLAPFGREPALGFGRVLVKARHLRPDEKAEPVRPVEPARVLRLLMLARPVEAEGLRKLDVLTQRLVARRGQQPVWKVPLVQHETLHERRAVQPEAAVSRLDLAQPEVAVNEIGSLAILAAQSRLELVEDWRLWMPRHRVLELQPSSPGKARPSAGDLTTQRGDQLRLAVALDLEVDRAEMQDEAFGLRRVKASPVPDDVARQLAKSGERRLGAEGHQDGAVEGRRGTGAELPFPVQIHPLLAHERGSRVLRTA